MINGILLRAIWTGIIVGLLASTPLGPLALESMRKTVTEGFKEGFKMSLGGILVDILDIILINFGIFKIIEDNTILENIFFIFCGIFIIFVGYHSIKKNNLYIKKAENKSKSFIKGFFITLLSPFTHSFWLALSGTAIRAWRAEGAFIYYVYLSSIIIGMIMVFFILNLLAHNGIRFASNTTSKTTSKIISYLLILMGIGFILWGIVNTTLYFNQ